MGARLGGCTDRALHADEGSRIDVPHFKARSDQLRTFAHRPEPDASVGLLRPGDPDAIIRDHVVYSMTAAVVPIPLVDIGGVAAIQLRLIKDLADTYGVAYDGPSSTALVSSLVGASLARMGASAAKAIPGIGWFVGGARGGGVRSVGHHAAAKERKDE